MDNTHNVNMPMLKPPFIIIFNINSLWPYMVCTVASINEWVYMSDQQVLVITGYA